MAFQRWFKFKEAFSPSFVVETIGRLPYRPKSCLDPFGGSGTTALVCQFLGIESTTIEVNPFMADVAEAKLSYYDPAELRKSIDSVLATARKKWVKANVNAEFKGAPKTFVEPGEQGRWIFNAEVAKAIIALRSAIEQLSRPEHARFLRVMLGSRLVEVSNIIVNGKGRRYRRGWQKRSVSPQNLIDSFEQACSLAVCDIESFKNRKAAKSTVLLGDARKLIKQYPKTDFVLTSPPYPNSFDYTDIYNVELWTLGYLKSPEDNRKLRQNTIRSHVQICHSGDPAVWLSRTLAKTYRSLVNRRGKLWNPHIPEMVCNYFEDTSSVLEGCRKVLEPGSYVVLAVGNSRYDGVLIDVPKILTEIVLEKGFRLIQIEGVRSMRASAQQGGRRLLNESLIWLSV